MTTTSSDSSMLALWLDGQASPHTRSCYRRDASRLLAFAHKPLERIGLGDLQSFAQSLIAAGLAPISRARTLAAIKSLFGFGHRMRFVATNPAAELALPRYPNRLAERILGEQDVQRLLAADLSPRDQTLLHLLYAAGLRVSEACGLRWRNLQGRQNGGQITVWGKNGRTRAIALPATVWAELIGLREVARAEEPVFRSRTGKPLDRGRVRLILRRAAARVGLEVALSPHWLRHAHASHALDRGAPIHLVQATLGHSSVATTSLYLHARPGDSSARFLEVEGFPLESCSFRLPLAADRGINGVAVQTAKGDYAMTSNSEQQANEPGEPKASKRPNAAPRRPRVATATARTSKGTTPARKRPQGAQKAKTAARQGSKTAKVLDLLKRPDGATLQELMAYASHCTSLA